MQANGVFAQSKGEAQFSGEILEAHRYIVPAGNPYGKAQVISFVVGVFDSDDHAEQAFEATKTAASNGFDEFSVLSSEEVDGPDSFDQSKWIYTYGTATVGFYYWTTLLFRIDNTLHMWFTIGLTRYHYGALAEMTETFIVEVPSDITKSNALSMLPNLRDIPLLDYKVEESSVSVRS